MDKLQIFIANAVDNDANKLCTKFGLVEQLRNILLFPKEPYLTSAESIFPRKYLRKSRRRVANALKRRRKRIRSRLRKTVESSRSYTKLVDNLSELDVEIRAAHQRERARMVREAFEKIKADLKYFYSYAKTHSVVRTDIAMM